MKRGRPRKKHHIKLAQIAGLPIEDHQRLTGDCSIPKSPLDDLPPPNPKTFRRGIKRNLVEALRSLSNFSRSVQAGRTPDWPPESTYSLFMAQLRHFRLISKRKENAPAIQLMREIDHTWRGLKVVDKVERFIAQLQNYMGNTVLGSANAKSQFERQIALGKKKDLISLVFKKRLAGLQDLDAMRDLLPVPFRELDALASKKFDRSTKGDSDDAIHELRTAVARSAQEYLWSEQQRFSEKCAAAKGLREFIFGLKYRPYTKKLFGFSQAHIAAWDKVDQLEAQRVRQKRFRQKAHKKKRPKKRYASR